MPAPSLSLYTQPMNLTTAQLAAVMAPGSKRLIVAGPGSGKTHTTVAAILHDIQDDPAAAGRVICITFTNRAAHELRTRLAARGVTPYHVGTLHSLALRMAGRVALLDEGGAADLLAETIASLRSKATPTGCRSVLAGERTAYAAEMPVVAAYRKALQQAGAADYDTILTDALESAPGFKTPGGWLLYVDEFQDSAPIDIKIYDALDCERRWVVGDGDQCIFEFRGANADSMAALARRPGWNVSYLNDNFRSGVRIVLAAQQVIQHNANRLAVPQDCHRVEMGAVLLDTFKTAAEELAHLVRTVTQSEGQWAILCRYNVQRKEIEDELRAAGAGLAVPMAPPPRDQRSTLALLAVLANPESRLAHRAYWRATLTPSEAQRKAESGELLPKTWPDRFETWDALASFLAGRMVSTTMLRRLHSAYLRAGTLDPALLSAAMGSRYDVDLIPAKVTVLTQHAAKGLEFDNVWIPGADVATTSNDPDADRRLFYVAMTRARETLRITQAQHRRNAHTNRMEERLACPWIS